MAASGWVCLEDVGDEFKIFSSPERNFSEAITPCVQEENGTLARICSLQEMAAVVNLGNELDLVSNVWIGVAHDNIGSEDQVQTYHLLMETLKIRFSREGVVSLLGLLGSQAMMMDKTVRPCCQMKNSISSGGTNFAVRKRVLCAGDSVKSSKLETGMLATILQH